MAGQPLLVGAGGGSRLDRSGRVVLDATGAGTLEIGPVPPGQIWLISRMTVAVTGPTVPMPSCYVYDGPIAAPNLIDATWTGTQDVSDFGTPHEMQANESLTFRWTGGTAGTTATARLIGRTLPAP